MEGRFRGDLGDFRGGLSDDEEEVSREREGEELGGPRGFAVAGVAPEGGVRGNERAAKRLEKVHAGSSDGLSRGLRGDGLRGDGLRGDGLRGLSSDGLRGDGLSSGLIGRLGVWLGDGLRYGRSVRLGCRLIPRLSD